MDAAKFTRGEVIDQADEAAGPQEMREAVRAGLKLRIRYCLPRGGHDKGWLARAFYGMLSRRNWRSPSHPTAAPFN